MREQLNGLLLNEIINLILFLLILILYINSIFDKKLYRTEEHRDFSRFLLFSMLYIGTLMLWMLIKEHAAGRWLPFLFSAVRVFWGILAYSSVGSWIITIIEEKQTLPPH